VQRSDHVSRVQLMPSRGTRTRTQACRRRYRRRRLFVGGGLLLCCWLLVQAGFKVAAALSIGQVAADAKGLHGQVTTATPQASSAPTSQRFAKSPTAPTETARPTPVRATEEYARATGGTVRRGSGTLVTYRVEVETGTGQSAPVFAVAVDATLADPASWTGQGRWSLQRVEGDDVDFVIRLATPATVDTVCATAGLDTRGYVSCRAGKFVMINLDRWLGAVADYRGDVALYRQYLINHEVGHHLGYGHQACPGPGRLAPVMQQQTFGLNGCLKNGWPYVSGVFVSGPAVR